MYCMYLLRTSRRIWNGAFPGRFSIKKQFVMLHTAALRRKQTATLHQVNRQSSVLINTPLLTNQQANMNSKHAGSEAHLRLVLVGTSGVGKSATGNTILGKEEFESELSPSSLTLKSEGREGVVCGRRATVVDTPGLFNTVLSEEKLRDEMQRAVSLCDRRPSAFLLVIQLGRFTQQEKGVLETLQELFSKRVNQYTMVLFTYGDRLGNKNIDEFIRSDTNLQQLIQKCGHCYHVFNNKHQDSQVTSLFEKLDKMLENKPPFHDMTEEGNITHTIRTAKMISFTQCLVIILGVTVGSLSGGFKGAIIGAVLGCAVAKGMGVILYQVKEKEIRLISFYRKYVRN